MVSSDKAGYKAVNYTSIVPILVEAVKEQQEMIKKQQILIDNLTKEVELLK